MCPDPGEMAIDAGRLLLAIGPGRIEAMDYLNHSWIRSGGNVCQPQRE